MLKNTACFDRILLYILSGCKFMRIIASDYDGTLNHKGITAEKINAIEKWRESGNLFVLVTGRGAEDALKIRDEKPFPCDYILSQNGAVIMNSDGNVLCHKVCNAEISKPFLEEIFKLGCLWGCVHSDKEFFYVYADVKKAKENKAYTIENMPEIPFVTQINTALKSFDEAQNVTLHIKNKFSGELNPLQNGNCIDIVPFGMDKAEGIYMLLDIVGGTKDDVIAVGDNINDAAMIKEFYSYAMENGVDYIKSIANHTTEGVTELIKKELC